MALCWVCWASRAGWDAAKPWLHVASRVERQVSAVHCC